MKNNSNDISNSELIKKVKTLLKREGAKRISIFGSYARNQNKKNSDIDIMVKFHREMGYLEFIGIENKLTERLGRKVDLITEEAVSPYIIENIKKDEIVIYESA
jgi:hypothetical protein